MKLYAEPIASKELCDGEVYFSLQFADRQLLIPELKPFVFLGKNLSEGDVDQFYFQDFASYSKGIRLGSVEENASVEFQIGGLENLRHIFNFDHALDSLIRFSMIGIRSQRSMKIVASCGTMGKPLASKPETTQWCRSSSP